MEFSPSSIHRPMKSRLLTIRPINLEKDAEILYKISSGEPYEGHPGFDSEKIIWDKLRLKPLIPGFKAFQDYLNDIIVTKDHFLFTIDSNEHKCQVGVVYLELDLEIKEATPGGMWISPFYQNKFLGLDYAFLIVGHCFDSGAETVGVSTVAANPRLVASFEKLGAIKVGRFVVLSHLHHKYQSIITFRITKDLWMSKIKPKI